MLSPTPFRNIRVMLSIYYSGYSDQGLGVKLVDAINTFDFDTRQKHNPSLDSRFQRLPTPALYEYPSTMHDN